MPSTKPRRLSKAQQNLKIDKILLDFKRKVALEEKRFQRDVENEMNKFDDFISRQFQVLPPEIKNLTLKDISEIFEESNEEEEDSIETPVTVKTQRYFKAQEYASKLTTPNKKKLVRVPPNIYNHTPKDQLKTSRAPIITPKIIPNRAITILRQPREGETVISMTGSPLLVSANMRSQGANLMVPLQNGDILSVNTAGDLRKSLIPELSPGMVEQLKALKRQIDTIIPGHEGK